MLAAAVLLAVLAAFTKGPLAGFRVLPPVSHRVLDVVLAVALFASPLACLSHPSAIAIGLLEVCGLVMLRIGYVGIRPPRPPRVRPPVAAPVGSTASPGTSASGRATSLLEAGARSAGRASAQARRKVGEAGPVADDLLGRGAKRLGGVVGRRAAKRAGSQPD